MKKLFSLVLACIMLLSLAACGTKNQDKDNGSTPPTTEPAVQDNLPVDSLELLEAVWATYGEDEKFPSAGGDYSEENNTMGGPGRYGLEDPSALDYAVGVPEASVSLIVDAASLTHMMNVNTFTCGAFKTTSSKDAEALTAALMENIMSRQWMCGFPDKLVIIQVGDYVISAFGNEDLINTFAEKVQGVYASAAVVVDNAITVE